MTAKNSQSTQATDLEATPVDSRGTSAVARTDRTRGAATAAGHTSIADHVVAKIAGMAARRVRGVHQMGGGAARAFDAVRERIPGSTSTSAVARGVAVEVGERQAAVDFNLVVEYGARIPDLAAVVRRDVVAAVQGMTGLEVTEVNITVDDIHLPDEDETDASAAPRVQ